MAQVSGDHGFVAFYSFFHVKSCRDSEKKGRKSNKSLDMPEHPATEGLHPLRHNFAEELGSNGPEKYSMATIEVVPSGTQGQCLTRTSRGNSMTATPASSHTQEEQRVPKQ